MKNFESLWIYRLLCCAFIAVFSCRENPVLPDPALTPEEVVVIHMDALQKNDTRDSGISVAWGFASPRNREHTGPLERFVIMVHNEIYRPLLNCRRYEVRVHFQEKSKAEFFVLLEDKEGLIYSFMVGLSLQDNPPYEDCWMIDAIIPMELPGNRQPKVALLERDRASKPFL